MTGEERRQSILEAAIAVIARTSFERCTIAVISREAGVTEPLIYRHFTNKKGLQLAVLDNIHEALLEWINIIDRIPSPSFAEMRSYGELFHRDVQQNPARITVLLKAQGVEDSEVKEKVWEILKSLHTAWTRILAKVVDKKQLAGLLDVDIMAWLMTAWVSILSLLNQLGKKDEIPDEKVDQFAAFLDWAMENIKGS